MTSPGSSRARTPDFPLTAMLLGTVLALASGVGCGIDDVGPGSRLIGGRCTVDRECDQLCLSDAAFPGGYCSVRCRADSDCPSGAACIPGRGGGLCVAVCGVSADCITYGPPYSCQRVSTFSGPAGGVVGSPPGATVCIAR